MKPTTRGVSVDRRVFFRPLLHSPYQRSCTARYLRRTREAPLAAKQAIIDFVRMTTDRSNPKFMPASERIAVFDQDGRHPRSYSNEKTRALNVIHAAANIVAIGPTADKLRRRASLTPQRLTQSPT
jgi:hypothetical protein